MATPVTVVGLFIYPVKSMRGIARSHLRVAATGFEWDRQWMIVDEHGTFLTQRTHPQLARLVPRIEADALLLQAAGLPDLRVPFSQEGARLTVTVWKDTCIGIEQGSTAREWLGRAVGEPVRLVRAAPDMRRMANPLFAGTTSAPIGFPDGFPFLVCSRASLEDLNTRLPEAIPIERFRPNLVLEGLPPWAEDRIDTLSFGEVTLRLVKPSVRCAIPSLNHETGAASTNPLPVLRRFRFNKALRGVTFGENAVTARGTGLQISLGQPCQIAYRP